MAATHQEIVNVISQRLWVWGMMEPLLAKHGLTKTMNAIDECAWSYVGAEEIGSSDASYMVESAVAYLGEPSIFKDRV